ncbi:MAG: ExbD/TolR family protein [Roseiarcus sp.]
MGMSIAAGRKGGRRRRGVPRYGAMADINMTPFIDIMLVLLIIFMVAAPLLATGVAVDLPQTKAGPLNIDQKPISIAINDQGQLFLMDAPIANDDLIAKLQGVAGGGFDERIYLRADKGIPYGRVAEVMASLAGAGYKKVALVTETDKR